MSTYGSSKFIVLTTQRSGSTWVIDVLSRLDNTKVYGELFLEQERTWDAGSLDFPRFCETPSNTKRLRSTRVFDYLGSLYSQPNAVGFKLMYSHLVHYPEILIYLRRHRKEIRILHQIRRNYLNVIISKEMVKARGQAHLLNGSEKSNATQVYLDPSTIVRRIRWAERKVVIVRQLLNILNLVHLEIGYEDLLTDASRFDMIRTFLGLDTETSIPQSGLRKIVNSSHEQTIQNYIEIKKRLASAGFAYLIE